MLGEFMFKIIKSCHSTAQYLCKPSGGGSGIYTRLSTGAGNTTRHELNPLEQQTGLHQWRKTTEPMLSRTALLVLTLTYLSPSFSPSRSNRKKSGVNNQYFRDKYCCWTIIFTPWKKKKNERALPSEKSLVPSWSCCMALPAGRMCCCFPRGSAWHCPWGAVKQLWWTEQIGKSTALIKGAREQLERDLCEKAEQQKQTTQCWQEWGKARG